MSQWDGDADPWHRRRNVRYPVTKCQALRVARPKGRPERLTVADHRGPDAVSCPKCTRSTSEMGDPEQFHSKSECGLVKILRCAQNDSVDIRIGIILKGVAVRLHARSPLRWGSLGSCPKRVVFRYGVRYSMESCPKGGCFRHWCRLNSALPSPSVQSEEGYLQRYGRSSSILPRLNSNWSYMAKIN